MIANAPTGTEMLTAPIAKTSGTNAEARSRPQMPPAHRVSQRASSPAQTLPATKPLGREPAQRQKVSTSAVSLSAPPRHLFIPDVAQMYGWRARTGQNQLEESNEGFARRTLR